MLLAMGGCYNTIFYISHIEASVSSLPVEISVSSLVLLAAEHAESLMKLLGFFVFWFFVLGSNLCFGPHFCLFMFVWRVLSVVLCLFLGLLFRGGFKKSKIEKNRAEHRTETEKTKPKKNQTELSEPNRTEIGWFGFGFDGPETGPNRTEPIYIII